MWRAGRRTVGGREGRGGKGTRESPSSRPYSFARSLDMVLYSLTVFLITSSSTSSCPRPLPPSPCCRCSYTLLHPSVSPLLPRAWTSQCQGGNPTLGRASFSALPFPLLPSALSARSFSLAPASISRQARLLIPVRRPSPPSPRPPPPRS